MKMTGWILMNTSKSMSDRLISVLISVQMWSTRWRPAGPPCTRSSMMASAGPAQMQNDGSSLRWLIRVRCGRVLLPAILCLSACVSTPPAEQLTARESTVPTCCDREYDGQPVLICPFVCRKKPQREPEPEQSQSDCRLPEPALS